MLADKLLEWANSMFGEKLIFQYFLILYSQISKNTSSFLNWLVVRVVKFDFITL